jgi:hypothetical protein
MTHAELQSYVDQSDKLIDIRKQVAESTFMIESVIMLQGSNLHPAAYRALCVACDNLKKIAPEVTQ